MTSFVLDAAREASAWISRFNSSGMRRRTTGLEPGSVLLRPVGRIRDAQVLGEHADGDVVQAHAPPRGLADERALQARPAS